MNEENEEIGNEIFGKELIDSTINTIRIYYFFRDKTTSKIITHSLKNTKTLKMKLVNVHPDCTDIISGVSMCSDTYNYFPLVDKIRSKKFVQKWIGYNIQHYRENNWFSTLTPEEITRIQETFMSNERLNVEHLIILAEMFTIDIILIENNNFTLIGNGNNECICLAKFNEHYFYVILETEMNTRQLFEYLQNNPTLSLKEDFTKYFINDTIEFEEDQAEVDKNLDYNYYKMLEDYVEWQKSVS